MIKLSEIVTKGAIIPQVASSSRDEIVVELIDALLAEGAASPTIRDELISRVIEREKKGSTGFGRGVAVPHVKHKSVPKIAAAIGLAARGVDFNALDKAPVYSIFLLLSPEDRPEDHLQAMEAIFKNLSKETFRRFLRQSTNAEEVFALLQEADSHGLPG